MVIASVCICLCGCTRASVLDTGYRSARLAVPRNELRLAVGGCLPGYYSVASRVLLCRGSVLRWELVVVSSPWQSSRWHSWRFGHEGGRSGTWRKHRMTSMNSIRCNHVLPKRRSFAASAEMLAQDCSRFKEQGFDYIFKWRARIFCVEAGEPRPGVRSCWPHCRRAGPECYGIEMLRHRKGFTWSVCSN